MRLSIRKKLIAFVVLPTLVVFVLVGGMSLWRLHGQLADKARERTAERAGHYSKLLDIRFQAVARIAASMASFVEDNPHLTEDQLTQVLRREVEQDPLIYGAAVAFEPFSFDPDRRLVAPYVHDVPGAGVRTLDLGQAYDYHQPDNDWWWDARERGEPVWTAPYFDEGGGDILMATHAVPFHRGGIFWGVATIDIPLADLHELVGIGGLSDSRFAIVDKDGRFVYHPQPEHILVDSIHAMADRLGRPELDQIARDLADKESGLAIMPDWENETQNLWVCFSPIPSTGWTFVDTVNEGEALTVVQQIAQSVFGGLVLMLLLVVAAVVLVSKSLTDPIKELRGAVQEVAGGNLEADPIEVTTSDEIGELETAFNTMVADLRHHVNLVVAEQTARKAMEGELEAARKIQAALLPRKFPPYPERKDLDLHASLIPAKSVAGDFFDFFLIDEDTLLFTVGDVSGKGVPAAMFMAVARTLIRNLATLTRDPGEIFTRCNRMLAEDNPGAMFVTCFLGVYDIPSGRIIYANAGHPLPLLVSPEGGVTEFGRPTGTMLGAFDGLSFGTGEEELEEGRRLVLFTDGVDEAEAPDGTMMDNEGVIAMLGETGGMEARELCDFVCRQVEDFQQDNQADDITVLVLGRPRSEQ